MSRRSDAVKILGEVAKNHQYTLLQDAWHYDDANFDFAYSKDLVNELAASGVKHYVVEVDKLVQPYIDKLASGEMSKRDFVDLLKNDNMHVGNAEGKRIASDLADMVINAKENGIKVHALDQKDTPMTTLFFDIKSMKETNAEIGNMKVGQVKDNLEKYYKTDISKESRIFVQRVLDGLEKLPLNDTVDKAMDDAVIKERVEGDKGLAETIKAATNGEKTAIMFGVQHGMNKNGGNGRDLDEHLGNSKVGKVLLTPNSETYNAYILGAAAKDVSELPTTIVYTDATKFPGHEVQAWQAKARAIGAEINCSEFKDTEFSQLKLPKPVDVANAPRAISVNEAEVKSR